MRLTHLCAGLLAHAVLLSLAGCGGSDAGSTGPAPSPAAVEWVAVPDTGEPAGLAESLVVRVLDNQGQPLPGVAVAWSVAGGGSLSATSSVTDAAGTARVAWEFAAVQAPQTATATADTLPPLTVTRTAHGLAGVQVATGYDHSCLLTAAGAAYCWGDNQAGELGDGTTTSHATPVRVQTRFRFSRLAIADLATCGLTATGAAYCWGDNQRGSVGDGTSTNRVNPTAVSGGLSFTGLAGGGSHFCGVTAAGAAYCWGNNELYQLGDGTPTDRHVPTYSAGVTVADINTATTHTCGWTAAGVAYCWGADAHGEIGDGTVIPIQAGPSQVSGGLTFGRLTLGEGHTCAVVLGAGYCWGDNSYGQLGDGTTTQRAVPVAIGGALPFTLLGGGLGHSCGLTTAGQIYCWGNNLYGQLGDGTIADHHVAAPIGGNHQFKTLSVGGLQGCALETTGRAWCWGDNTNGILGDGTTSTRLLPTAVTLP